MKRALVLMLFAFNVIAGNYHSHFYKDWTMIAGVKVDDFKSAFKEISNLHLDIAGVSIENKIIDVLIDNKEYRLLSDLGYEIDIINTKGVLAGPDQEYKNPQEVEDTLEALAWKYPNLTTLQSIGKSLEGRDIWAIKLTSKKITEKQYKPTVLFNSMHHAREIMTPEVSLDIIEYLLINYGKDKQVTRWLDNIEVWVIPMFNVDGNNKMWNEDKFWRKNTRNGYGVDLNRNYPAGWGTCNGSSGNTGSQTYRGPAPASEPETQAMMNFISNYRPVFDISYHAYSELVIYPYGCGDKRTQTKEVVETIGKKLGDILDYKAGTAWELLYNADGGDIDWMYEAYQVIPYVIELNDRWAGFHPKYKKWRNKTVKRNRPGWQFLLDRVHKSGIRGRIFGGQKSTTSQIIINVFKLESNTRTLFQKYITHKDGYYHIVVNPGIYSLEAIINGKVFNIGTANVKDKLEFLDLEL
ncbi:MAG: M14 family metallopeptidase [Bacteriovoracaceae bacterium]|nr:M14 family metallopeptidase [Bacteriovoracaceae bacterium]